MSSSFLKLLDEIGLDSSEKKVYFSLVKLGQGTVGDIYASCDLPRTTIKSVLDRLFEKRFIIRHQQNGILHYWVDSLETVENDLYKKIGVTQQLDSYVRQFYKTNSHIPGVKVYDKQTNIRSLIEGFGETVSPGGNIYTIDSPGNKNYLSFFAQKEFEELMAKKKKRKIITYSLIPFGSFDIIPRATLDSQEIAIREMPKDIVFGTSLWIIEGKVVFFSGETNLIVEITNPIIHLSMKSVYDFLSFHSREIYSNF